MTQNAESESWSFSHEMDVRDYECDLQGIVNNSCYQNYLEHVRHLYLKQIGLDFAQMATDGINLVVVRVEIDYKSPLRSGDRFRVDIRPEPGSKIRFCFIQQVVNLTNGKVAVRGKMTGAPMNNEGRPMRMPKDLLEKILAAK